MYLWVVASQYYSKINVGLPTSTEIRFEQDRFDKDMTCRIPKKVRSLCHVHVDLLNCRAAVFNLRHPLSKHSKCRYVIIVLSAKLRSFYYQPKNTLQHYVPTIPVPVKASQNLCPTLHTPSPYGRTGLHTCHNTSKS